MTMLQLYLLFTILPNVDCFMGAIFLITIVIGVIFAISIFATEGDIWTEWEGRPMFIKYLIITFFASGFIGTLAPGKEQIITMVGAYALTNDRERAKLPDNILKAANSYLHELDTELAKKKDNHKENDPE
jgi:hypothetical protein